MIPDEEPWWMVRANTGLKLATEAAISNYRKCMQSAAHRDHSDDTPEPTDFRPFGYEW